MVPVLAGTVLTQDVPLYLDGLGTVQAFNTVTIRSRVEGQLKELYFKEGQDVKAGDLLLEIDPDAFRTQVQVAEAKKAQDEAQLANARIDLKRNAELLPQKIVAQQVYDAAKALVDQYEAAVKSDQAAIDNAKVQLGYTQIRSPIDGRVGLRLIDKGNMVTANDPNGLLVITQLKPISVVFTIPEQFIKDINAHKTEEPMTVLAVDRDNTTVIGTGKLAVVDNQIDTATATVRLKANFPNDDLKLWPGQFVNARLLLTVRKGGIVVPVQVVQRGPNGSYAFVINDDMTVQMQPIKVGQIERGMALIESGLSAGQRVVLDGQYKLQNGSKIKITQPGGGNGSTNGAEGKGPRGPGERGGKPGGKPEGK
jgi:multidrug efflux system membrane fusion protein